MLVNCQMFVMFHSFHFLILAVLGSSHFAGINLDEESLLNIYRKVIEVIIIQLYNIEHYKNITYMIVHGIFE